MFASFNWYQFFSAFIVLFAIIDITGSIPVLLDLKKKGKRIKALQAALVSFAIYVLFFYVGEAFLNLFGVDISSFAMAGSLIIFVIAMEMILDIEIFKTGETSPKDATIVPVVFPLIAGSGSLTTLLAIRSQYEDLNILLAVVVNLVIVYIVLKATKRIESFLGAGMIYMLRKFFGIILLAISVKMFIASLTHLLHELGG